jgi:hypothetical protein
MLEFVEFLQLWMIVRVLDCFFSLLRSGFTLAVPSHFLISFFQFFLGKSGEYLREEFCNLHKRGWRNNENLLLSFWVDYRNSVGPDIVK